MYAVYVTKLELFIETSNNDSSIKYLGKVIQTQDSLFNDSKQKIINDLENKREMAIKNDQIEFLELKNKTNGQIIIISSVGLLILIGLVFIILQERKKSEKILKNIMPASVVNKLKHNEDINERHSDVTIVILDMVHFTERSIKTDPSKMIGLLNKIFIEFDKLCEKYDLTKIKTDADSYLVAGNLPLKQANHTINAIDFVLDARKFLFTTDFEDFGRVQFRKGIHVGFVVAGVIGEKRQVYDVLGDTVNIASILEKTSDISEIHKTEEVYNKVKDRYIIEARGNKEFKAYGNMNTYYKREKGK